MDYKKLSSNPIAVLLQLVGAKWKILVVQKLLEKSMRFCELKHSLGCTSKVLTTVLKEMETDGLVIREEDQREPNKVEYYLTDIGYTLQTVIEPMSKWGRDYKKLRKIMEKNKLRSLS